MKKGSIFTGVFLLGMLIQVLAANGQSPEYAQVPIEKRSIATIDSDGVQRLEITGGDYFFDPRYIVLKAGVPTEFTVKKEGGFVPHNIIVAAPEAGIDFSIELDKKPKIVKFTPQKAGKYEIYCGKKLLFLKSHKERGMRGVIEVVP